VLSLVNWAGFSRLVRSLVISVKQADYIKVAICCGTSLPNIILRHVLPNIAGALLTIFVTNLGNTILQIAGLSFLGLGAQPPTAEWGMMINEARVHIATTPALIIYPLIAVSVAVLGFNLIGDGLKDVSDAREL